MSQSRYKEFSEGQQLRDFSAASENLLREDVAGMTDSMPGSGGLSDNGVQSRRSRPERHGVLRMKITDKEPDSENPHLVLAKELEFDSDVIFTSPDRPVRTGQEHEVGDVIHVVQSFDGLKTYYGNQPVEYMAIGEQPHGQIEGQLFGNITQNVTGFGLPKAVPDLTEIEG